MAAHQRVSRSKGRSGELVGILSCGQKAWANSLLSLGRQGTEADERQVEHKPAPVGDANITVGLGGSTSTHFCSCWKDVWVQFLASCYPGFSVPTSRTFLLFMGKAIFSVWTHGSRTKWKLQDSLNLSLESAVTVCFPCARWPVTHGLGSQRDVNNRKGVTGVQKGATYHCTWNQEKENEYRGCS